MNSKNVFKVLAFYMIGFGIFVGIIFPFFIIVIAHVPSSYILTPIFFSSCVLAGFIVGLINIFLSQKVVGSKIEQISSQMKYVEKKLDDKLNSINNDDCLDEDCYIKNISNDKIGICANAFNALVKSLSNAIQSENNVRKFNEMLSNKLELNQLAEEALCELIEFFNASGGTLIIEREGELVLMSSYGIKNPESFLKSDIVWKVLKDQKRTVINIPDNIVLNGLLVQFRPNSIIIEPILYKGIILGVVVLASVFEFTYEIQNKIEIFGYGLAVALKNAIAHDQLQKLAANDPLTGIFNRRFGLLRFKDEFTRAVRTNQPIGIIIFDIDHFKKINDTYGHIVGDKVLVKLTQAVRSVLREGDIFLRYGGEEFIIIFPGASINDIVLLAERVMRIVNDTEIPHNDQKIKITLSIGGSSYPENEVNDFMEIVKLADAKLYRAKETGRNRAIIE